MYRMHLRAAGTPQRDPAIRRFSARGAGRWPRIALAIVLAAMVGMALAQSSSATFNVPRQSIDGGAQRASSATYMLNGTVGQPDAGPAMSGTSLSVRGGFHRATTSADLVFANGFEP